MSQSKLINCIKRGIIPFLGMMLLFSGCEEPRHHYIYNVKAAIYDQKGNQWIVKYLGPQTKEVNSRMDVLSESNLMPVFYGLPGLSDFRKTDWDIDTGSHTTYYDFEFGILHIEYQDYVSDLQKQSNVTYFVECRHGSVYFYSKPEHYDPTLVQFVISHAVPVN